MIFYGWGKRALPVMDLGTHHCAQCGDRPFRIFLNYSYFNLYWIFGLVTRRRYIAACTNCSRGTMLDKKQVQPLFAPNPIKDPVPFMDKWGLAMLASAVVMFFVIAAHR